MKNKINISILITTLILIIGCSKETPYEQGLYDTARTANFEASRDAMEDTFRAANLSTVEHKLVKRANIRIRVENPEAADDFISTLMVKYNAYSTSTNIEENSRYYSLRVPSQYYNIFLSDINSMGRLLNRNESTEDVTLRYYDLEGRLATKKELLRTFQSYLGKASSIEEILAVEARIAELQYDIDGTGIQFRNLADKIDYTTIDLTVLGPVALTQFKGITFSERVKQLLSSFGGFLSTIAVIIIGVVVYGIPIILLLGLIFWLFFGRIGLFRKLWKFVHK